MKTTRGDLLALARDGAFDVIAHGCNCFNALGNGIAGQIKRQFPAADEADKKTVRGAREKLGTCTTAVVGALTIVNAYTQFSWSKRGAPQVDYEAVRACMRWMKQTYAGKRIGLPRIGAGLAGGDWGRIAAIIDEELAGEDVTLVEL